VNSDFDKNVDFNQYKRAFHKKRIDKAEISQLDKKKNFTRH
jgi:hypothetical protein